MSTESTPLRLFAILALALSLAVTPPSAAQSEDTMAKTGPIFSGQGAQPGEAMPDVVLTRIDGSEVRLSELWGDRPTVLVTGSLTCPTARSRHPGVEEVAAAFGDGINVAYIYTVEAHPETDPSPYGKLWAEHRRSLGMEVPEGEAGEVWEAPINVTEGFSRRQPTDFATRQGLAAEFDDRLEAQVPILIDGMDNAAWEAMGGGPNMGVLVREGGVVEVKHGWFDGPSMKGSIEWLLERAARGED